MIAPRLAILAFLAVHIFGESKEVTALKEQLAASQAVTAAAARDKAALQAQLAAALQSGSTLARGVAANAVAAKAEATKATAERAAGATAADANARALALSMELAITKAQAAVDLANAKTELADQRTLAATTAAKNSTDGFKYPMYSALGVGIIGLLMAIIKVFSDRDDRRETRSHRVEELKKIDASAKDSTDAIQKSNHLTQKIVDMREDLVKAVAAVAPATNGAASGGAIAAAGSP